MINRVCKELFWKEFSSYFKPPLGYVFLVIYLQQLFGYDKIFPI